MINTLEDMLVEVQKYDEDARICEEKDWNMSGDPYITFNNNPYLEMLEIICYSSETQEWETVSISSTNPQDILDILRTIYNCGLQEEEKIK